MKKYPTFDELKQTHAMRQRYDELKLFQLILRSEEHMNVRYHGRAQAIADGLQPWIEALEISLGK